MCPRDTGGEDPPVLDLPEFDIPEDPGVAECDLPQDPFGEFYLMLTLSDHVLLDQQPPEHRLPEQRSPDQRLPDQLAWDQTLPRGPA